MTNKFTSSLFVNISPILTDRDNEYRKIQMLYDYNSRMRRLVFEIEKHFIQKKYLIKSTHCYPKNHKHVELLNIEVKHMGDFEDYLYKLEFKKLYKDVFYIGDRTWLRRFKDLIEYAGALPHFQNSFFTDSDTIIKNVQQLSER